MKIISDINNNEEAKKTKIILMEISEIFGREDLDSEQINDVVFNLYVKVMAIHIALGTMNLEKLDELLFETKTAIAFEVERKIK